MLSNAPLPGGTGTFTVTLLGAGTQTLTVTDTANSALSGVGAPIAVSTTPARVGVFDASQGIWYLDNQGNGNFSSPSDDSFTFGTPGATDTAIVGDWNGAGAGEVGVYRVDTVLTVKDPLTGLPTHPLVFSLDFNGNNAWDNGPGGSGGDQSFVFGVEGDTVVIGDWNGDGKDEIGVVRPGSDGVLVWSLDIHGSTGDHADYVVYHFGDNGDTPLVGDWNGAGKTEIGTVRTVGGSLVWSLDYNGNGTWDSLPGDRAYTFGQTGDVPLVGDWTGTGTTKIGTYRQDPNGMGLDFSLDMNGSGVFVSPKDEFDNFGLKGDTGIVGDWMGNGRTDIGSYRTNNAAADVIFSLDNDGDGVFDPCGRRRFDDGLPLRPQQPGGAGTVVFVMEVSTPGMP